MSFSAEDLAAPVVRFADPYKKCETCHRWVDGFRKVPGPLVLVPCGHSSYRDVCPSWSPVDGCRCAQHTARHPDNPIVHEHRTASPHAPLGQ